MTFKQTRARRVRLYCTHHFIPVAFCSSLHSVSGALASAELYCPVAVPGRPTPALAASDSDLCRREGLFAWNSSHNCSYLMWLIRGESHPFRRPN